MSTASPPDLDAVVLADDALAAVRIAGLSARERAVRVAHRVGATRVLVIDGAADRAALAAWRGDRATPLLVIRADQLVHTPLVAPLLADAGDAPTAIAVGPDDAYAGALVVRGPAAARAITALAGGDPDGALAGPDARRIPHGEVARHPIATAADRAGAHRLLYRILIKPQDNAITRYLYRPVSFPLTRVLAWTPITPNQISYAVAALVAIGCWLTAGATHADATIGTAIILAASYLDCCDGEIARLKLRSSRFGAWLDTVVDELTTLGYTIALGWHCHVLYGSPGLDPWLIATAVAAVTYPISVYCIYYNIIVGVGSANSQDYAGRFEVVPAGEPDAVALRPIVKAIAPTRALPPAVRWLATYAPYLVRRDFIAWASLVLVGLHLANIAFAMFVIGNLMTISFVTVDHLRLRALIRTVHRAGQRLVRP